ncbi:hypothetical protein OGAPHI_005517 [Ogataea philodendri]|uniref:Phosphatidic acid phosphatase type 2/haloperoxidase domain-containing protein n=1 Tax=Ogataea philodendri TaxID=1378263 RepID=A0A9P8T100_9ASCO|nr:uncharacterized protein OGAPHI_005517 [Ogataea philodendri]KAH3662268.1 hypothetical protein OGAPHI_005517 [Ogataea philodendri]
MVITKLLQEYRRSKESGNTLPLLNTQWNPLTTLRSLDFREIRLSQYIHYTIVAIFFAFELYIMEIPVLAKPLIALTLIVLVTVPITSQFFNYALPVLAWVFLFFSSKYIPLQMRPPITVKVLPGMETILYGDNLSQLLASYTSTPLDIIAWIPYGILHFSLPFVVAALVFIFGPPKTLRVFSFTFGYMNLVGVVIQNLLFACAPPWYKVLHGLEKANYSMKGSPGGLARIDQILGIDMYTTAFTNSPLIFGALPSLHSACASLDAIWLSYLFPKFTPLWCVYVSWLWFSTMYLTHHYFFDLTFGCSLAIASFYSAKLVGKLAVNDKFCRWSYDMLNLHDPQVEDPLATDTSFLIEDDLDLEDDGFFDDTSIEMRDISTA